MSLFSLSEPVVAANVLMSEDNSRTNSSESTSGPKDDMTFDTSKSASGCDGMPIERLSAFVPISIKTEEVLINRDEGLCTTLSDNSEKNEEMFKNSSPRISKVTKNLKEISAIDSIKTVKDSTDSTGVKVKEKRIGRKEKMDSAQIERVSVTGGEREKETLSEISGLKEAGQQTHSCPSDGGSPRRMKRKVNEHSRTMQTRSSSGSLPKTCQIQTEIRAANESLRGLGVKKFHCTVCKESFTQRKLKKHMLEMHEGQPSSSNTAPYQPMVPVPFSFTCPLCHLSYRGKYCLKRHFANKHLNTTDIPCYKYPTECKYKAKTLTGYLKHVEKHKPKQRETLLNSPPIQESQSHNSLLECRECFKLFQSRDALRLHVIGHKITLCLAHTQTSLPLESISNFTHDSSKTSNDSCLGVSRVPHPTPSRELPQELRLQVEDSLNSVIKMTSQLESLARSLSTSDTSSVSLITLPAINSISTLSSELTNLSTALGCALHRHVQKNDGKDVAASVDDPVERETPGSDNDNETEEKKEEIPLRINEVIQENDTTVFALEGLQDFVLEEDDGLLTETDDVTVVKLESVMETSGEPVVVVSPFRTKAKTKENQDIITLKVSKAEAKTKERQARAVKRHSRGERDCITWKKVSEKHKLSTNSSHNYKCQECGKNLKNFGGLRRHLMIHKDLRPYKCSVCKMSFRRSEHLKKHMVIHSDERPFKCDVCDYSAKTARNLHTHSLTHGEHQCFPCQKCSYKGRTAHELSKHEKKHNPCPICSYVATDNADYSIHRRSHLVYFCSECSYSCYSNWQLRRHSKTHNPPSEDVEMFRCKLCDYSCVERRHFVYHMERHENKTPFSCSACDYKCSSRSSFDAHKLMHANLRPFLCSICGASFRRSSHLNNHMLIHKDEKSHVCGTCGRSFRARHNLKAHEMIHSGEKKYKCLLCSFACRRNRELRIHMTKHVVIKVLNSKGKDAKVLESQKD